MIYFVNLDSRNNKINTTLTKYYEFSKWWINILYSGGMRLEYKSGIRVGIENLFGI